MKKQTLNKKSEDLSRKILLLGGFIALIAIWWFSEIFLKYNFIENGESYHKGFGHILEEDLFKGIVLLVLKQFFPFVIISYLVFEVLPEKSRQRAYKLVCTIMLIIVTVILTYGGLKIVEISRGDNRYLRISEIMLTWLLRTVGIIIGYQVSVKGFLSEKNNSNS